MHENRTKQPTYFDSTHHFWHVVETLREFRKQGVEAIGLSGSRLHRVHIPHKSDTDILVIDPTASQHGRYHWRGPGKKIQVVAVPVAITGTDANSEFLRQMQENVRWLYTARRPQLVVENVS